MEITTNQVLSILGSADNDTDPPNRFTAHNGIVFAIQAVPPLLLADLQTALKEPKPPVVWIADKEVNEENPNDPAYVVALQEYQRALGELVNSVLLTRGTRPITIPDGMEKPDDPDWLTDIEELGITVPNSRRARYYAWLKYVALADTSDWGALLRKTGSMSGITFESEVQRAVESFRNNETRGANTSTGTPEADRYGDNDSIENPWRSS